MLLQAQTPAHVVVFEFAVLQTRTRIPYVSLSKDNSQCRRKRKTNNVGLLKSISDVNAFMTPQGPANDRKCAACISLQTTFGWYYR